MPFKFSFSSTTSAAVVGSASVNDRGTTKGWAYKRESYSNNDGSGVRTTKQRLGEAPVTNTRIYDAQGRPLLIERSDGASSSASQSAAGQVQGMQGMARIEDVTDRENEVDKKE
jgi:hypothetical protein